MQVTSAMIKAALRGPFPAPGWQMLYEVADDTGTRASRSADAVAMGIWPSNGYMIHGFEIKVSRGDFLNEMRDPTKAQAVFQFCDRWSLVTPTGMVKASELPETWGLMTFDGTSIRTVKQAPALTPVTLTRGFIASMLRRAGAPGEDVIREAADKAVTSMRRQHEEQTRSAILRALEAHRSRHGEAANELEAYREIFGDMTIFEIKRIAQAVKAIQKLGLTETWGAVKTVIETMKRTTRELEAIQTRVNDDLI